MFKIKIFFYIVFALIINQQLYAMKEKPYHHLPNGTFRNPEGSPKRDSI